MAKNLSNSGIVLNQTIYPQHVSQSVDAFTGADDYDITISGSLTVTGSNSINGDVDISGAITINGNVVAPNLPNTAQSNVVTYNPINGQFYYTSSDAISPATASNAVSSSFSQTASYSYTSISSSYAETASWAINAITASYVQNAQTASYVLSASYAVSSSISDNSISASYSTTSSYSYNSISSSYALSASRSELSNTASYALTASYLEGYISPFPYTGSAAITGSLEVTGSTNLYDSGSTVLSVYGSHGLLFDIEDTVSGSLLTVWTGSIPIFNVDSSQQVTISGSLSVSNGITGSLFGTSSWAENSLTSSYTETAQTASYVINSISSSLASTASYVNQLNQNVNISGSLNVTGSTTLYNSGSSPFIISGSKGTLFEVTDSVSGSLWVIYTGSLPIFDVSSDRTMTLSGSATITGSLNVYNGITGSLLGTSSYSTQALSASWAPPTLTFPYTGSAAITGSLEVTGSVDIYKSGSTVLTVSGSTGPLLSITDEISGPLLTVASGSTNILVVDSSLVTTITGSLDVQGGITGSLEGTASYANQSLSASWAPQTPTFPYTGPAIISGSLYVSGSTTVNGSGSTVFSVSGSTGVLFDVSDVMSGSLFTVWTGSTPILNVDSSQLVNVSGSLNVTHGITGSLEGTASYALTALTASYAPNITFPYTGSAIISGSLQVTGSLNISSSLTVAGVTYPTMDGDDGDVIFTDGAGNLSFGRTTVFANVKNITSGTLQKGTPVHVTGSAGNANEIVPSSASIALTMPAHFILNEDITAGSEGKAIAIGFINGINTSGFTEGDTVYVGSEGGYTNIKPTGSNLIQNLGIVTKIDASNGSGYVLGAGRSNDVPNIAEGYVWVGDNNGVATPVTTSSIQNVVSSSYAQTASYVNPSSLNPLIALTEISASSLVTHTIPTGTNFTAINLNSDATNRYAKITFTAPASGKVSIEMLFDMTIVNSAAVQMIGIHSTSTSTPTPDGGWYRVNADNDTTSGQFYAQFIKTGLTPGNSYTYYFMGVCDFSGNTIRASRQQTGAYSAGSDLPNALKIFAYDLGNVTINTNPSS